MDKITQILENVVRCKYFEAGVHIKNPIKNLYQDGFGRTTQTLDHVVVVHILIWDQRKSQINAYSDLTTDSSWAMSPSQTSSTQEREKMRWTTHARFPMVSKWPPLERWRNHSIREHSTFFPLAFNNSVLLCRPVHLLAGIYSRKLGRRFKPTTSSSISVRSFVHSTTGP